MLARRARTNNNSALPKIASRGLERGLLFQSTNKFHHHYVQDLEVRTPWSVRLGASGRLITRLRL